MTSVSAVIITYNEERNIARCLDSLTDVVDEIIVVDSFSTDNTEEIINQYDAMLYWNAFDNYAAQKNWGIEKASHDYILSIDADEVLSDELRKAILKEKEFFRADVYKMARYTNFCGRWINHSSWNPDIKLRLFHKEKAQWEGESVHEILVYNKNATVKKLDGKLLHFAFHTLTDQVMTVNRYANLKAQDMYARGKTTTLFVMVMKPMFKFLHIYIIKAGFLDGFEGFVIARNSAYGEFIKHAKLRELGRKRNNEERVNH